MRRTHRTQMNSDELRALRFSLSCQKNLKMPLRIHILGILFWCRRVRSDTRRQRSWAGLGLDQYQDMSTTYNIHRMCKVDQSWWCKALLFLRNLGLWPDDPHLWRQAGGTYSISYACLLLRGTAVDWKNYTFAAFGCNRQRCNFLWMGGFRLITHDQFVWGPSKHVWRARSQSYHRMSFFEPFRRLRFDSA